MWSITWASAGLDHGGAPYCVIFQPCFRLELEKVQILVLLFTNQSYIHDYRNVVKMTNTDHEN